MTSIAFIGLGVMGRPMVARLIGAGHDVHGVVRSESAAAAANAAGIPLAESLEAAVQQAEIVITMLPDTPDVVGVVDEVVPALAPGALLIDMSTIDPGATRILHESVSRAGGSMLDAPVSGGEAGAREGVLSIMVGGDPADLDRARPVLETMGTTIVHVGPAGAGQVVKAANQLVVAGNIQMLAEALVFLRAHGVELESALEVLGGGLAGSTVLNRKSEAMLTANFRPGFRSVLHAKDLGIVETAARTTGLALPLTAVVTQMVRALVARGDGGLDHSALYKLTLAINGRPLDEEAGDS